MLTEEERAEARARRRARLAALPPPTEERVARIAALFASITLRKARDRARTAQATPGNPAPPGDPVQPPANPLVKPIVASRKVTSGSLQGKRGQGGA